MVNTTVYRKLVEIAKARGTVQFTELARLADMPLEAEGDVAAMGRILDEIAEADVAAGRPLLAVLVVHGDRNMPGAGLFRFAKKKKLQKGDDLTFFVTEMARVHEYWKDKEPAIEWFCTIPFGMNAAGMAAWYYQGDGLRLWEETYAAFNLVPRPAMGNDAGHFMSAGRSRGIQDGRGGQLFLGVLILCRPDDRPCRVSVATAAPWGQLVPEISGSIVDGCAAVGRLDSSSIYYQ